MTARTDTTIRTGQRRALCCECGTLRYTASRSRLRQHVPENMRPDVLAEAQAQGEWLYARPYWRLLGTLKCATCGGPTRHALLRDHEPDDWRNYAERVNYGIKTRGEL